MLNKAWQALLLNIMKDSIKKSSPEKHATQKKLMNAAKFYEDCSSSFARKVSAPFITPASRRRIVYSLARKKSPCAVR